MLYLLFWPVPVKPVKWTPPKAPELKGDYAVNQTLSAVERLPVGGRGPEDVIFDKQGRLYTGLEDGRVVHNLQDPSGAFPETSGATEHDGMLYVGSLSGKAVGRLRVPSF